MKRKICFITGTRAEYGLLYWLMKGIQDDSNIKLQIIVTGMHLSPEFGLTFKEIEKDSDRDKWMRAEEAKKYGIIDEVLIRKSNN